MSISGYSVTPLLKKLGIKDGMKVLIINMPEDYFTLLNADISSQFCRKADTPDIVHLFAKNNTEFEKQMRGLLPVTRKNTNIIFWVSWYKKASGIATDLTEDMVRNFALTNGLVDVKVCAVSDTWSGLKLVVPLKNR